MNRAISAMFLVAGVILLVYGVNASHSVSSDFSRLFTGSPTDKAVWMIVGGAAAAVIGLFGSFRGA